MADLISKLIEIGLLPQEAELYAYIHQHPDCCVSDACNNLKSSKSAIYRAFDGLKTKKLVQINTKDWKYSLRATPLSFLIEKLETQQQRESQIIDYLKSF